MLGWLAIGRKGLLAERSTGLGDNLTDQAGAYMGLHWMRKGEKTCDMGFNILAESR